MPGPGFEPGLLRPQRSVLTTRRNRRFGAALIYSFTDSVVTDLVADKKILSLTLIRAALIYS